MACIATKAALYIRVSTEEQAVEGQSVDAQIETLTQYCKLYDIEIYDIYKDLGVSGKSAKNRPSLQLMLRDACSKKFNMVLVWKISRLSRSLKDLLLILDQLEKNDIVFSSYSEKFDTSTPVGRMTLQLLGSIAEFERNTIIDNVKLGLKEYARKGGKTGTILGYDNVSKQLIVNPQEAEIIKLIYRLYAIDRMSLDEIAELLNARGYVTKRGKQFRKDGIAVILDNPAYIGLNRHNVGTCEEYQTAGAHQPIIDINTWETVQELRQTNRTKHIKKNKDSVFLLSSKIICSCCGSSMIGFYSSSVSKAYRYYKCKGCGYLVNAARLDGIVIEAMLKLLQDPQIIEDTISCFNASFRLRNYSQEFKQLQTQITNLSNQFDKYLALHSNEELKVSPIIIDKIKSIEQKINELNQKRIKLESDKKNIRILTEDDYLDIIDIIFHGADKAAISKAVEQAIKCIAIDKKKKQGTIAFTFLTDNIDFVF